MGHPWTLVGRATCVALHDWLIVFGINPTVKGIAGPSCHAGGGL
jgi:hypothetical protein